MATPKREHLLTVRINGVSAAIGAKAAEKVAPLGLDQRMIAVLLAVEALGAPSQQQISMHTRIDRTTVSKTIDTLESGGLVDRNIDPSHRRRNWIGLTPQATRTLARVQRAFRECDAEFLSVLSTTERRQLAKLLDKLETSATKPVEP